MAEPDRKDVSAEMGRNRSDSAGSSEERARLEKQIRFIVEVDKVKNIFRQTYLADGKRKENDAEHSWHLALMAVLLKEHMKEEADLEKVMIMVLIHDLVEIDAGDTYAYDEKGAQTKREREVNAAERIFGLLPEDQGIYFRELWEEFEAYEPPEARFAHTMDNFQPLLLNDYNEGKDWTGHQVRISQVLKSNEYTETCSSQIWEYMKELMEKNVAQGRLIDDRKEKSDDGLQK